MRSDPNVRALMDLLHVVDIHMQATRLHCDAAKILLSKFRRELFSSPLSEISGVGVLHGGRTVDNMTRLRVIFEIFEHSGKIALVSKGEVDLQHFRFGVANSADELDDWVIFWVVPVFGPSGGF